MRVMTTARRWKLRVARLFREAGHRGSPIIVLYYLAQAPKGLTLAELAVRMEAARGTLARLVSRLERDGMVSRRKLVGDARARLIMVEPSGHAAIEAFDVHASAMRARLFEGVSDADLSVTLRVLDVVMTRLGEGPDAVIRA